MKIKNIIAYLAYKELAYVLCFGGLAFPDLCSFKAMQQHQTSAFFFLLLLFG